MLTIVVTDSRGRALDSFLDHDNILVSTQSGAKLHQLADRACNIIYRHRPDVVLLMGGINNLTILNRHTRRVSLISTSRGVMINYLIQQINEAKALILGAYPDTKLIIGGIAGMCINTYNRLPGVAPNQWLLDDTITAINAYIRQMNRDSGVPHPRLTSKIHTWRHGRRRHVYKRLYDGLHPSDLVLHSWARQIRLMHDECIRQFVDNL